MAMRDNFVMRVFTGDYPISNDANKGVSIK